jgi:hypothetical protein
MNTPSIAIPTVAVAIAGAALATYSLRLGGLLLAAYLPRNGAFSK